LSMLSMLVVRLVIFGLSSSKILIFSLATLVEEAQHHQYSDDSHVTWPYTSYAKGKMRKKSAVQH
jgi:hypothetical protein